MTKYIDCLSGVLKSVNVDDLSELPRTTAEKHHLHLQGSSQEYYSLHREARVDVFESRVSPVFHSMSNFFA